jgi:single-stranded-DNA-specific exonuclease
MTFKKWQVKPPDYTQQQILAHELNVSPITAQLLLNRGILTCDEARLFLSSDLNQLHDPFLLPDMDKAVERILFACERKEKVLIHGDYDVDGITSTVLLKSILEKMGAKVSYYLPNRFKDGYGVNCQAIREARAAGVKLVITVDCGIGAFDVVAEANASGGPDIIITDHHQLPEVLPPALAVINPKRGGYPFCDLAGVGVVFKLAQALYSRQTSDTRHQETIKSSDFSHQSSRDLLASYDQRLMTENQLPTSDDRRQPTELASYLDLVCLGTIADVVPLTGENRILVKHGLVQLAKTSRPGLLALIEVCGLNQQKQLRTGFGQAGCSPYYGQAGCPSYEPALLSVEKVSFALVPRLNAAGRMNDASLSVDLLTSENFTQAMVLARELDKKNQERQALESKIFQEALAMLGQASGRQDARPTTGRQDARPTELVQEKVIILDSPAWHLGVIGIVASRLAELFYRPVFLIVRDQDLGRGSARSIPGFDIYSALKNAGQYLTSFGGHVGAAGFSLPVTQIEDFRQAVQNYAAHTLTKEDLTPKLECEMIVSLSDISFEVVQEIERMAPFGYGNPRPLMACLKASVLNPYAVGKEKRHLRLTVVENEVKKEGIIFNWSKIEPTNHQRSTINDSLLTADNRQTTTDDQQLTTKNQIPTSDVQRPTTDKMAFIFTPFLNEWNNQAQVQLQIEDFKPSFAAAHLASSKYNFLTRPRTYQTGLEVKAPRLKNIKRYLFFLPEFIHQKIKTYKNVIKKNKENILLLTGHPAFTEKGSLTFIDWRQQVNRFDQLTKLLSNNKQTLILVNCPYQTVELAFYLRQVNPQDNDKLAFYHLYLPYAEKKAVFNLFTAGKLKFLATTLQIAPLFLTREWEQVVIFHLPFHYQSWQGAINVASLGKAKAVYLLFGRQDCLTARKHLEYLAPERDCLAKLYLFLLKQQNKNNIVMKETSFFDQTVKILRAAGLTGVNGLTMQISLRILAELGLINFSNQRLNLKIEVLPAPAKKLALLNSITFCYTKQLKKEVLAWQEQALALPLTELINTF